MNPWKVKKGGISLSKLTDEQKKTFWLTKNPASIGFSQVYHSANCNEYNFAAGKKDSNYAKVLKYLSNHSASKVEILANALGVKEADFIKNKVKRYIKNGWCVDDISFESPLRGYQSCLFSALNEAGLAEYKDRKWSITNLGKWYLAEILKA